MASVIAAASRAPARLAGLRSLGSSCVRWCLRFARIRYRLLLINVIVAAVPLVGISFAHRHEQQLLAALEADMVHQAEVVRAVLLDDIAGPRLADRGSMLAAAARDTRTRIRLVDEHGDVKADSHAGGPPEGAERAVPRLLRSNEPTHAAAVPKQLDVGERAEIRRALAGHYGAATRLWDKQDRVYLFVALPIVRLGRVEGVVYVTRSTHDVKVQLYTLRAWLARLLVATIAITALLTLLLATTIARPLGQLTRRAQRIAARRPVEPELASHGSDPSRGGFTAARRAEQRGFTAARGDSALAFRHDEIGDLARAVAAMTDELERRAHDARTLAADLSHEFKTPLSGIRGAAELLRDGAADDPEARERFLAMIDDDASRLDRLVSRLLELARVEDDRGTALPVDLAALARTCAARPWSTAVEVTGELEAIARGRTVALAAAIENLVANATQHADAGSIVQVSITRRRHALRLTVANRGPAISPTAQARVWDRFYSTRTAAGGSGVGLAIVRSVALAHNGVVGITCRDGITAFWFEIDAAT